MLCDEPSALSTRLPHPLGLARTLTCIFRLWRRTLKLSPLATPDTGLAQVLRPLFPEGLAQVALERARVDPAQVEAADHQIRRTVIQAAISKGVASEGDCRAE